MMIELTEDYLNEVKKRLDQIMINYDLTPQQMIRVLEEYSKELKEGMDKVKGD